MTNSWSNSWVSAEEIPEMCKLALVASEDSKFYEHHGLDFESLQKSYQINTKKQKFAKGGSTLTQQLVKNAFLSRDKTYLRKVREIVGALILDATVSKEAQLTWYLNIVEFGPRVYGLETAALHYFQKHASALDKKQCISLAALLPAPNKWSRSLEPGPRKNQPSKFLNARIATISRRMAILNPALADEYIPVRKPQYVPAKPENLPVLPELPEVIDSGDEDLQVLDQDSPE